MSLDSSHPQCWKIMECFINAVCSKYMHTVAHCTFLIDIIVGMQQSRTRGVARMLPITLSTVYILAAQGRLSA